MNAGRSGYAVVDFETTGFRGFTTDRVVEIGVVCLDCSGEVADEWTTLVNPERDVSASHIHGITGRDVYGAPRFADVAGALADSLRGRVLVAHNLSFEAQFLRGEFARLGHDL
jgi:DNA polymerase-3 subunit epsilon